ncbi:MAG: S41 family peptidase [Pseudomonadota bacterium]
MSKWIVHGLLAAGLFSLCACSDGSAPAPVSTAPPPTMVAPPQDPAPTPAPTPDPAPTPTGPTWEQGVFEASSVFKDRCEAPRSGVDIEGTPFPDLPGSLSEEKFWLRSWTNETYLWNDEVVDQDPALFSDPIAYFDQLKTFETTPSGRLKDQTHFSQPTEEVLAEFNSAPRSGYGARLLVTSPTPPREVRVLYTEPASPASDIVGGRANFVRGSLILEADGIDVVNGGNTEEEVEIINNALSPLTAGETHTFRVRDPDGVERDIVIVSEDVASSAINAVSIILTGTGTVGYVSINTFNTEASEIAIQQAIDQLSRSGVNDLVLDLRYNEGGLLAIASQLAFMITGESATAGRTFEALEFNDDAGDLNPVTGDTNEPFPFINQGVGLSIPAGQALPSLSLSRVFILSTATTCSASESVINGLRGIDVEVVLIGDVTCGKPFGFFPQDNCGTTYFTTQFRGVNDKGFGDFADGFAPSNASLPFAVSVPGCSVPDDFSKELGDPDEALFAAALQFRADGTCPPVATSPVSIAARSVVPNGLAISDLQRSVFDTNKNAYRPTK